MTNLTYSTIIEGLYGIAASPVTTRLNEAEQVPDRSTFASTAAWQAAVLKLTHGGFGRYVDSNGTYVARSVPQGDDMVLVKITGDDTPKDGDSSTKSADGTVQLEPDANGSADTKFDLSKKTIAQVKELEADPEFFKQVLSYIFAHESKKTDRYRTSKTAFATATLKDGSKRKFYALASGVPGLAAEGQSQKTPTALVIDNQIIPLSMGAGGSIYDIRKFVDEFAKEYAATASQPAAPAPKPVAAPVKKEPPAKPAKLGPYRVATVEDAVSAYQNNLKEYLERDVSGGKTAANRAKRFTEEKGKKITEATNDVAAFLHNPTKEAAIALCAKYSITTNASETEVGFQALSLLNDAPLPGSPEKEDFEYFFDSSREMISASARNTQYTQPVKTSLISALQNALGKDFMTHVMAHVTFKTLINPSVLFRNAPGVDLKAKKTKTPNGTEVFEVDGMKFPVFFEYNDPQLNQNVTQFINEATTFDEQVRQRSGVPLDADSPELDAKAKNISDSVLLYQKRLKYFDTIKDSWVKLDGRDNLLDVTATLREGIKTQAMRVKLTLTPDELDLLDALDVFTDVDPNMTPEEIDLDFKDKWTAFANRLVIMPHLNQTRSSLAETMVVLRELRQNKKTYIPLKSNVKTIDAIGLADMANFTTTTVDDLLDVEDNIRLLMSSIDLVSVKSSLTAKKKASGETAADESGGAAPAISGLLEVCEIDSVINKKYVDFFKTGKDVGVDVAVKLLEEMLADQPLVNMLYEYYEIPPTPKVPEKRLRDLRKAMLTAPGLGNKVYQEKALLGKIGECILNRGTTYQMFQNVTLSNRDVRESNSKDSVVAFRFVGDNKGFGSFKYKIAAQVNPTQAKTISGIESPMSD